MLLEKLENNLDSILEKIENLNERARLKEAYEYAKKAHEGQVRKSGEPYITHPLSVGLSLWDRFQDVDLTIAGFLHDTVEDCKNVKQEDIYKKYGENIGFIVDSITKTEKKYYNQNKEFNDERDKMLYGGMHDIGCILVKLADREHNLATLEFMPKHKQVKKSFESQSLYLPLMNILEFDKKGITIEKAQKLFNDFLVKNDIKDYKDLKNVLFNTCFHDFSEELFDIVYNNSTSVLWEIEDKNIFKELLDIGWFDSDFVEVISLLGDLNDYFKITFKVNSGFTLKQLKKLKLAKNFFIT